MDRPRGRRPTGLRGLVAKIKICHCPIRSGFNRFGRNKASYRRKFKLNPDLECDKIVATGILRQPLE
jgi:hypothetical protein